MAALSLIVSLSSAHASEVTGTAEAGDRRLLTTLGSEPALVASAGYLHGASLLDHDVALIANLTVPVYLLDGRHHRLELAGRAPVLAWRDLGLQARLGLSEQTARTALFEGTTLGVSAGLLGGVYTERGFVAAELTTKANLASHLVPSEHYTDVTLYAPPAGWYGGGGGYWVIGLQGGVTLAQRVELALWGAVDATLRGGTRTAPVNIGLGVNVSL